MVPSQLRARRRTVLLARSGVFQTAPLVGAAPQVYVPALEPRLTVAPNQSVLTAAPNQAVLSVAANESRLTL